MLMPNRPKRDPLRRSRDADMLMQATVRRFAKADGATSAVHRLRIAADLRDAAEAQLQTEIIFARTVDGMSWAEIAREVGVSPQALHRKYSGYRVRRNAP
jgi:hypothetical protein